MSARVVSTETLSAGRCECGHDGLAHNMAGCVMCGCTDLRITKTRLERQLIPSITLAKIEGFLRGMADTMESEAEFRECNGHTDDVIRGWARDMRALGLDCDSLMQQLRMLR